MTLLEFGTNAGRTIEAPYGPGSSANWHQAQSHRHGGSFKSQKAFFPACHSMLLGNSLRTPKALRVIQFAYSFLACHTITEDLQTSGFGRATGFKIGATSAMMPQRSLHKKTWSDFSDTMVCGVLCGDTCRGVAATSSTVVPVPGGW